MNLAFRATIAALALAAVASNLAWGAPRKVGSGTPATQQRDVRGFSGIAFSLPGRLEIVQGDSEGVTLTADDNLLGDIETRVERGILHVREREGARMQLKSALRVVVRARTVESIAIAGSGDVHAGALRGEKLSIAINGSGDVRLGRLEARAVETSIHGSGDVALDAGSAESLEVRISGSGDVKAGRLEARRGTIAIAGSGDVVIWAREALEVRVAGSGDVRYYGDPRLERTIAGSGSVRRAGAAPG